MPEPSPFLENLPLSTDCPMLTADLPGVGGVLKSRPEDFVVEEIPAYQPCGDGEHLFLWIEKINVPADQLGRHLAMVLGIAPRELGTAGLKDTRAVTRQFVSVPRRVENRLNAIDTEGIRLLNATPHQNKLRTGHLRGNRFQVLVRDVEGWLLLPDQEAEGPKCPAYDSALAIAERLRQTGVPNYYGSQRFGNKHSTLKLGLKLLTEARSGSDAEARKPNRSFLHRLALSAAQSWLFNNVLAERLRDGLLHQVMLGDVMQKSESGGIFDVRDVAAEQPRFDARETVLTGPMFGPKMRPTQHEPAVREQRVLAAAGLTMDAFRRFGHLAEGTRRPLLIWPDDLQVRALQDGLQFEFSLSSGAYATVVLREFMKNESDAD
ncbi:MAG: tRNA pseudouridine(13) synthase TruD [Planctomycetes bacterium]|nr:tRNA pseudouridine(13) synthase TruD [Planctomycetota bacterium]